MNCLQEKILKDGIVLDNDVLKVDGFLNHQIDVGLLREMGCEFRKLFADKEVTKILTAEASGIAIACYAAEQFDVPVVFAKKGDNRNVGSDVYKAEVFSFTKGRSYEMIVNRKYLGSDDKVLIIDDFLANGKALLGLRSIVEQAGAKLQGAGIAIIKTFQPGYRILREEGMDVRGLACIKSMDGGKIVFED